MLAMLSLNAISKLVVLLKVHFLIKYIIFRLQ